MSSKVHVLISGAGIAGPVCAYWLGRVGIRSTIVERSSSLRTNGQTIDIRGIARSVIVKMGVEEIIRSKCTNEEGLYFVDREDQVQATFPVDQEKGNSPSCDIEIVRYELSKIFYDASLKTNLTEYIFGDSIKNMTNSATEVVVVYESGREGTYDAVIIADGMSSRTRSLVFQQQDGQGAQGDFHYDSLGLHTSYFSIPYREDDGTWSRWFTATGSRMIWIRPEVATPSTRVFLTASSASSREKLKDYRSMTVDEQKKIYRDIFRDAGWKTERILDEMDRSEDFYMQDVAQIKAKTWHNGRVVLLGDAAYCPSPISGMGTSCAIVGAYVLAGELASMASTSEDDIEEAFQRYENILRPYIEKAQNISPTVIRLAYPETQLGVRVFNTLASIASYVFTSRLGKFISGYFGGGEDERIKLPDYDIGSA